MPQYVDLLQTLLGKTMQSNQSDLPWIAKEEGLKVLKKYYKQSAEEALLTPNGDKILAQTINADQMAMEAKKPTQTTQPKQKSTEKSTQQPTQSTPQSTQTTQPQGKDLLSKLLISIGSGLASAGGQPQVAGSLLDFIQKQQTAKGTKGVYGFDPKTGKVTQTAEVPEGADVRNLTPTVDMESLTSAQQVQAYGLSRKIAGVRGAEKLLPSIVQGFKEGKTIDQIEDELRFAGQSPEFSGPVRDAMQQLSIDDSESTRNANFDAVDDYIQRGDTEGAKDYIKEKARRTAGVEQANKVAGKERTIELLNEIKGDLDFLEKNGQPTGFIAGNIEGLASRIGKTVRPEFRKVATKVATAIIEYRRYATGVNFSAPENKEYKNLFPNINKFGDFNTANVDALNDVFNGDLKRFYSQKIGNKNYKAIFEQGNSTPDSDTLTRLGLDPNRFEIVR